MNVPTTRLWHQSMAPLDLFRPYADQLASRLPVHLTQETSVTLHGVTAEAYLGRPPGGVLRYPYGRLVVEQQIIRACLSAENEGYDAVVLATFSDPLLREARSAVELPVLSMLESALLAGCVFARRVVVLVLSRSAEPRMNELVAEHSLGDRVVVRGLNRSTSETELLRLLEGEEAAELVAAAQETVADAVRSGADLVIPGEGMLNEVLVKAGVSTMAGAPVMDAMAVVFAHAQMIVRLHRSGLAPGRIWSYPRPDDELLAALRRASDQ